MYMYTTYYVYNGGPSLNKKTACLCHAERPLTLVISGLKQYAVLSFSQAGRDWVGD